MAILAMTLHRQIACATSLVMVILAMILHGQDSRKRQGNLRGKLKARAAGVVM